MRWGNFAGAVGGVVVDDDDDLAGDAGLRGQRLEAAAEAGFFITRGDDHRHYRLGFRDCFWSLPSVESIIIAGCDALAWSPVVVLKAFRSLRCSSLLAAGSGSRWPPRIGTAAPDFYAAGLAEHGHAQPVSMGRWWCSISGLHGVRRAWRKFRRWSRCSGA